MTAGVTWGQTWPSLPVFTELALEPPPGHPGRTPRLLADAETPVGVYRKLAREQPGTFLLESAEHGGVWARYSIVGVRCAATLTEQVRARRAGSGLPPVGRADDAVTPRRPLRDAVAALATERIAGLPPLTGGMVGAISYDAVRQVGGRARRVAATSSTCPSSR